MLRTLIILIGVWSLVGCVTMEERCSNDVRNGVFQNMPQCMAFRQQQLNDFSDSMTQTSQALRPKPPQQSGAVDGVCQSQCLQAGYSFPLCHSKCSY